MKVEPDFLKVELVVVEVELGVVKVVELGFVEVELSVWPHPILSTLMLPLSGISVFLL